MMNSTSYGLSSVGLRRVGRAAQVTLLLVALIGLVAGCQPDHRMSFEQFLSEVHRQAAPPCPPSADQPPPVPIEEYLTPLTIGPKDNLLITPTTADATVLFPPLQVRVARDGAIDLPLVGSVNIAGLELVDAERKIHEAYVPAIVNDVAIHVDFVAADSVNVLVVGAVTVPGLTPLLRNERDLLHSIAKAGGASELASGQATLRRIRRPHEEVTFNLVDPTDLSAALALDPLEEGDIVYVHAAVPNTIFVGGLVNRPAAQLYAPGAKVTLLQALAAAGGPRTDVFPSEGTLIRRMPDGTDAHVKLDLNALARNEDENIVLAAGDILWVPETVGTRVLDFVNRNIFLRAGASVTYTATGIEFLNRHELQSGRAFDTTESLFDPFGFLSRNAALQTIGQRQQTLITP